MWEQVVIKVTDVLSQIEIDNLINAFESGEVNEETLREQGAPKIRAYDFRKPNKFSKEQISTFQVIYGNYVRYLGTFLSINLRTPFHGSLLSIEQVTYEEFINSLCNPSVSIIFNMNPMEGTALLEISPEIAFAMIERMMGGRGQQPVQQSPVLTEIERSLIENLSQEILDLSSESWENITKFNPRFERIETNPQLVQVVTPSDMVILISLDVKIGNASGVIQYCFPYIVLEPILDKFSAKYWFETTARDSGIKQQELLKKRIGSAKLLVRVVMGGTVITIEQLTNLQMGDVVLLNKRTDDCLDVLIGNAPKFYARPGLLNDKLAVRVVGYQEEIS